MKTSNIRDYAQSELHAHAMALLVNSRDSESEQEVNLLDAWDTLLGSGSLSDSVS